MFKLIGGAIVYSLALYGLWVLYQRNQTQRRDKTTKSCATTAC